MIAILFILAFGLAIAAIATRRDRAVSHGLMIGAIVYFTAAVFLSAIPVFVS